jgi:NADH-quinone oxidoreductase subunit L
VGFVALALVLSLTQFSAVLGDEVFSSRFEWLPGHQFGWLFDAVSGTLASLVLLISLLVHVFSVYYMGHDQGKHRYFAFLGFFTFSMLGLLAADHIVLVFVFWELVGFSSFLLIGFWYRDNEKAYNSRYAFITNRIADVGFLIAVLIIWNFGETAFLSEFGQNLLSGSLLTWACVGLLIGAMGKSAQFPFYTWLPRAMAGPTPVSALIHAATMVAAGVYLLVRVSDVLTFEIQLTTALVGALTMLLAAYSALVQFDIKKVLAYSTVSQLGYMVMAIGVGAPEMGFFHLWTHAFFKAGLFLTAGVVIHTMQQRENIEDPQDMRNMGDLRGSLKYTHITFLIFALALAGLPFFSGFFSKEGILIAAVDFAAVNSSKIGWIGYLFPLFGFITVFLTAFYMFRQYFLVFLAKERAASPDSFEPLTTVVIPLALLALGSLWVFYQVNPLGHEVAFIHRIFGVGEDHGNSLTITVLSVVLAGGGISTAFFLHRKQRISLQSWGQNALGKLSANSFYVDNFYNKGLVRAFDKLVVWVGRFDKVVIDGFLDKMGVSFIVFSKIIDLVDKLLVDGVVKFVAYFTHLLGRFTRLFTAARMQLHIFWLIVGVIVIYLLIR